MKLIIKLFCFVVLVSSSIDVYSCNTAGQPPVPGMTISYPRCFGSNVRFNVNYVFGQDSVMRYFDFGDGTYDTLGIGGFLSFVNHTYADTGTYFVSLIKINGYGVDSSYDTITVYYKPIADFSIVDSFCLGINSQFTDLSSPDLGPPIDTWLWTFNDPFSDTLTDSSQNTSHQYNVPGMYYPSLKVTNTGGCTSTIIDTISVFQDTALTSFDFIESCPCDVVQFTHTGTATSVNWDFGDNSTSTLTSPSYDYSFPDNYQVTLIGSDSIGCTSRTIKTISICNASLVPQSLSDSRWYFYDNAGMNFNPLGGLPTALTDGLVFTAAADGEGSSTVSDPRTGNLLFYTDGSQIWDNTHTPMPNGSGLTGGYSTAQTALIVPKPGNESQYYVFVLDGFTSLSPPYELRYSIVDMTLNGNKGDVIVGKKNILLDSTYGSENLAGMEKTPASCTENASYWIMISAEKDEHHAFLISDTGISAPVISIIGNSNHKVANAIFSPLGNKYAKTNFTQGAELFDFDINTGILSNYYPIKWIQGGWAYGISFSPDGSLLYLGYVAGTGGLCQFNLNYLDIASSVVTLYNGAIGHGSMRIGLDDKLYIARDNQLNLGVVNNPNVYGLGAGYVASGFNLAGKNLELGFQNLVPLDLSLDSIPLPITYTYTFPNCLNYTVDFIDTSCSFKPDSALTVWDYGDGSIDTFQELTYPSHTFSGPGNYMVSLLVIKECFLTDTFIQTIIIDTLPEVTFITDSVCVGNFTSLTSTVKYIDTNAISYNWSAPVNDTIPNTTFIFSTAGSYNIILTITDTAGCQFSDTNMVIVHPVPLVGISNNTICIGSSVSLSAGIGDSYLWLPSTYLDDNSIVNPLSMPDSTITYQAIVSTQYCGSDTGIHTITVNNLPSIQTVNDTTIDLGTSLTLTTIGGQSYVWTPALYLNDDKISSPTTNSPLDVTYIVAGTDTNGCVNTDTVNVIINVVENFYVPNGFSPNKENNNDEFLVRGLTGENTFLMKIYDRWGNKIFTSEDKNTGWTGENRDAGVYVYIIQVELLNGLKLERKGNITLIK